MSKAGADLTVPLEYETSVTSRPAAKNGEGGFSGRLKIFSGSKHASTVAETCEYPPQSALVSGCQFPSPPCALALSSWID